MNKANILILIGQLSVGGAERQCINLATAVDPQRFVVQVGVLSPILDLAPELERHGIPVTVLHPFPSYRLALLPELIRRIRNLIVAERVALVHSFLYPANVTGVLAAKWAGIPAVMSERSAMRTMPFSQRLAYMLVGRLCAAVTVNSYANRRTLAQHIGLAEAAIMVHWNGVDFQRLDQIQVRSAELRQRHSIPADAPLIGTICRIDRLKRLELLLITAALLKQTNPSARWMIVGGCFSAAAEAYRAEMLALRNMLGLQDTVMFAGHQPHPADYMRLLDLFLLTSIEEGTPNALLEAMALGKPALATDVGDVARIFAESGGGQVLAAEPAVWEQVITALLADPDRRMAMGTAGRAYIREQFRLERLAEETQALWAELLGKG
jgi:glycosyltransferase involved in cell wall biosynthesis